MAISPRTCDLIDGYFNLVLGSILLLLVIYSYLKTYKLKNLRFMNKLLLNIFCISIVQTYSGVYTAYRSRDNWTSTKVVLYFNTVLELIYEITTVLVIWIVAFKFIDSATKLEAIESHFEENQKQVKKQLRKNRK